MRGFSGTKSLHCSRTTCTKQKAIILRITLLKEEGCIFNGREWKRHSLVCPDINQQCFFPHRYNVTYTVCLVHASICGTLVHSSLFEHGGSSGRCCRNPTCWLPSSPSQVFSIGIKQPADHETMATNKGHQERHRSEHILVLMQLAGCVLQFPTGSWVIGTSTKPTGRDKILT